MKKLTNKKSIDERVRAYYERQDELFESLGITKKLVINFKRGTPSLLARIAIQILIWQGGFLDEQFYNLKK